MWGRLIHLSADAVLVSALLAGIKRNTGLSPAVSNIENEDIRNYVTKYLNVGEWMLDNTVVFMNNSPYFTRKNE
ncbi:hypothetical protein BX666DRAFT_2028432 [Dichotomocladium elegans]|nr:hypothetical protein BX666DRAFT_2028432 [Dichotomocladium elegans]